MTSLAGPRVWWQLLLTWSVNSAYANLRTYLWAWINCTSSQIGSRLLGLMCALRAVIQPCPNINSFSIGVCHAKFVRFIHFYSCFIPNFEVRITPLCKILWENYIMPLSNMWISEASTVTLFWMIPTSVDTMIVYPFSFGWTFLVKDLVTSLANQPTTMPPFKPCTNACRAEPLILWQSTPTSCCIQIALVADIRAVMKSAYTFIWVRHSVSTMPPINVAAFGQHFVWIIALHSSSSCLMFKKPCQPMSPDEVYVLGYGNRAQKWCVPHWCGLLFSARRQSLRWPPFERVRPASCSTLLPQPSTDVYAYCTGTSALFLWPVS